MKSDLQHNIHGQTDKDLRLMSEWEPRSGLTWNVV